MVLNIFCMRRVLEEPPKLLPMLWKSAIAAAVMGVVAYGAYYLLSQFLTSVILCCLGAIAAAVVVYVLMVIVMKVITYDDCMLLPKGEKIAKILKIH